MNFKEGEKLVRHCRRERSETYTAVHAFTVWSDCLKSTYGLPAHISLLFHYLASVFFDGVPSRNQSVTQQTPLQVDFDRIDSDLVEHTALARYQGWGKEQHSKVQAYLSDHDPYTIACEAPVFNDTTNGFIDVLRILPDYTIEIADFKPNAAKDRKAPGQITRYKDMMVKTLGIDPELVVCTWFDDRHAFRILNA